MHSALRVARIMLLVLLALAIIAVIVVARLWQDKPPLESIGWPQADVISEPTDMVTVTWLGTTTLLFDDRETQILIDGYFTRANPLKVALLLPMSSDVATINYALAEFRMDRLAAIVPAHSHFDHAMDVGHIANRKPSAVILGSESTINIARGADVPVDQYQILADGETRQFGDFTIRLLESRHAPVRYDSQDPYFPGRIDAPLRQPAAAGAWKQGVVWTVFIGHPRGTAMIQGSGGYIRDKLAGETADVVMLAIAGLSGLGSDYVTELWNETVVATGARRVIPVHWDDFTAPFGEVGLFPQMVDNVPLTADWIDQAIADNGSEVMVELPPFGQPIALY